MDERLFRILKKVYYKKRHGKDANGNQTPVQIGDVWDSKTCTWQYSTDLLTDGELANLKESGFAFNEVVHGLHDGTIGQLKEIIQHPRLTMENLLAAYVAGYGSFPRGRQPILSYLFARAVPVHSFCNSQGGTACQVCGLPKEYFLHKGNEVFRLYWGYAWNEKPSRFYLDLAEFCQLEPVRPTQEDWGIFHRVIGLIRSAPEGETAGKLEQRIQSAKVIPGCEKYRLRGQLMALAELGVMPNSYVAPLLDQFTEAAEQWEREHQVPGSPRSDIVLPLAGWRGEYGICEERFQELFEKL